MIPIITGVIASGITTSSVYEYAGSQYCNGAGPTTVYSSSGLLIIGSVIYTNTALTAPYTDGTFVKDATVYIVNGSGVITDTYGCFSGYEAYTDCTLTTSNGTYYVEGGAYTTYGTLVTTDAEGLNPVTTQSFVIESYQITTDAAGLIDSSTPCST